MSVLRLGTACAVFNPQRHVLLAQRADLGVWNLPSGRLDAHEVVTVAAAREVREETGIHAEQVKPLGLYYYPLWRRLNILCIAEAAGGVLQQRTRETRANGFFAPNALPHPLLDAPLVQDALTHEMRLVAIETPPDVARQMRRQLAWRWVKNLLMGRPEPRYPHFVIHASLMARDETDHVLSQPNIDGARILPGIECDGETPIWEQIRRYVRDQCELYELRHAQLHWIGLFQAVQSNRLEFIFTTRLHVTAPLMNSNLAWTLLGDRHWWPGYQPFLAHLASNQMNVLVITQQEESV